MGLTFLLALGVRLLYIHAFQDSVFFNNLVVDGAWHDEWAWGWASGSEDRERAFFRAPLYPFWLSLIYQGFGHSLMAVRLVQAVLGAGTAAALAGTGTRLAGGWTGFFTGVLAALYGPLIFFDAELLIPNLLVALLSWAMFVLARNGGMRSVLLAALLIGLAGVTRPNALVLLLIPGIWMAKQNPARSGARFRRWVGILGLGLLPALVVSMVNLSVERTWVFVSSQGGVNFYAGNHSGASGRSVEIPEMGVLFSWREFVDRSRDVAETAAGRDLDSGEVSRWWFQKGASWVLSHPGEAIRLYGRKLYYMINANEIPNNRDLYTERHGPLKWLLWRTPYFAFPWGLVFPLAVMGWAVARRERRSWCWAHSLGLWVFVYGFSMLPFFVTGRFRMGLIPPILIFAGFALARIRHLVRGWVPVLGILVVALTNSNLAGVQESNPAQELARRGEALIKDGKSDEAVRVLEQAHDLDPANPTTAYMLAQGYARVGRTTKAIELYRRVIDVRPGDPDLRFNLGVLFLEQQDYESASNTLRGVVEMRPADGRAWINLGAAYEGRGLKDAAAKAYDQGIGRIPKEELGYLRLADLLIEEKDFDRARQILRTGMGYLPESFELVTRLAVVHARLGELDMAMEQAQKALALRPGDPGAQKLKEWLQNQTRKP